MNYERKSKSLVKKIDSQNSNPKIASQLRTIDKND